MQNHHSTETFSTGYISTWIVEHLLKTTIFNCVYWEHSVSLKISCTLCYLFMLSWAVAVFCLYLKFIFKFLTVNFACQWAAFLLLVFISSIYSFGCFFHRWKCKFIVLLIFVETVALHFILNSAPLLPGRNIFKL